MRRLPDLLFSMHSGCSRRWRRIVLGVVVCLGMMSGAPGPAGEAQAQETIVSICDRANAVEIAILARINAVEEPDVACDAVTATQLAAITELDLTLTGAFPVPGDFDDLTGLTSLRLGGNEMGEVLSGTFDGLTSLEELELWGNALIALPPGIFADLTSLTTLDLDDNSLTALRSDTFSGLSSLRYLYMRRNALTHLPADLFVGLDALADMTLHDNLFTPATGLPIGVFDAVLDTLGTVTTTYVDGSTNFQIDDTVRAAHFVCSRGDADAIVTAASAGDCLRVTAAQFNTYAGTRFSASIDFDGNFGSGTGAARSINESTGSALSASTNVGVTAISRAFTNAPAGTASYTCIYNIAGTATIGTDWFIKDGANDTPLDDDSLSGIANAAGSRGTSTDTDCGPGTATSGTYNIRIVNDNDTEVGGETITISLRSVEAFNSGGTSLGFALVVADTDAGSTILTTTIVDDENAAATVDISSRTDAVENTILAAVAATDPTAVPREQLAGITRLEIPNGSTNTVADGDFANLTNLHTLDLSSVGLTALPENVFAGLSRLEVLWMSRNSFTTLPENVFDPLISLQQISLSARNANLTSLHVNQFEELTNLRVLWMGRNDGLTTLPATVFRNLVNLRELQLWSNSLTAVAANQFAGLSELRILTLTGRTDVTTANLTTLPAGLFDGLTRLQDLRLFGNDFTANTGLPSGVFDDVLDTLITIGEDANVRAAHFVCSRADADAIVAATDGVDDCLRITAAQLAAVTSSNGICGRTAEVQTAIIAAIPGTPACGDVTPAQLAAVNPDPTGNGLDLDGTRSGFTVTPHLNSTPKLKSGDFAGLTGLQRLVLRNNALTELPEDVFAGLTGLRQLWLQSNALTALPSGVFAGLTGLQTLNLNDNALIALPEGVFAGLTSLVSLFLRNNALTTLPEGVFAGLTSLRWLLLSGNDLPELPAGVFAGLTGLRTLWLFSNALTELPAGVFAGLTGLQRLDLNSNALTELPEGVFAGLNSLRQLWLANNNFTARTATDPGGLPAGIFDDVLDTVTRVATDSSDVQSNGGFFVDANVRAAHFVCARDDVNAIVAATNGVTDCLRITVAQLFAAGAPIIAGLAASGSPAEPTDASSGDTVAGAFTLWFSPALTSGTARVTYAITGAATRDTDYTLAAGTGVTLDSPRSGQVTIDFTQTARAPAVFTITPAHDAFTESGETVIFTVSGVDFDDDTLTDLTAVAGSPQTLTIRDNDVGICSRTPEVEAAILARINAVEEPDVACGEVTRAHLEGITGFFVLRGQGIASLQAGDFADLAGIVSLDLANNALTTLPADVFNGLYRLDRLSLQGNAFTPGTGLPPGIFDNVLDTLSVLVSDPAVRAAHFVCSRPDAAAIVAATNGVTDCLRITVAQLFAAGAPIIAGLVASGSPAEPADASSGDAVAGAFTLWFSPALTSGTATVTYAITGAATRDTDYTLATSTGVTLDSPGSGQFTIDFTLPARAPAVFTITPAHDAFTESGETVIFTVSGVDFEDDTLTDLTAVTGSPQTLTIRDNDAGICDRTAVVRDAIIARIPGRLVCGAVTGTQLGAITGTLNLSGQNIASLQAGDFAGLTSLQVLQLNRNDLTTLPEDVFDGLASLTHLGLFQNALTTAALPDGVFGNLANLRALQLRGNDLTTLPAGVFNGLGNLLRLELDGIGLTALDEDVFNGLDSLRDLWLFNNDLTELPAGVFSSLTRLRYLGLFNNDLTELPAGVFDGLDGLQTMVLSGNPFTSKTGLPPGIFDDVLDTVDGDNLFVDAVIRAAHFVCARDDAADIVAAITGVDDCLRITAAQFDAATGGFCARTPAVQTAILTRVNAVEEPDVACGTVTGTHLAAITGVLDLSGQNIASLQVDDFADLTSLQNLWLFNNDLTILPANVFNDLTSLRYLGLFQNNLQTLPGGAFTGLTGVQTLVLSDNDLTALPADVFNGLGNLQTLNLQDNALTTLPAAVFNGLTSIRNLRLERNALTTLPAVVFNGLTNLRNLNLSGNRTFTPRTGLPPGIFDDVLDNTLGAIATSGINGFRIDDAVRDAHFVCSRDDAAAIVTATAGVDDCLRITVDQLRAAGVPTIAILVASGSPAEPSSGTSGDAVAGAFTLQLSPPPASGTATVTYDLSGTAQASDYMLMPSAGVEINSETGFTITFGPTVSQAVLTLTPEHDNDSDLDETVMLTVSGVVFTDGTPNITAVEGSPQTLTIIDNDVVGICDRTLAVQTAILTRINAVEEPDVACDAVTGTHLAAITGILDLFGQNIASLQGDDFAGLGSLRRVQLNGNTLTTLPAGVFNGLASLQEMWLFNNTLTELPAGVFNGLTRLRYLGLFQNNLTTLPDGVFNGLDGLQSLNLQDNDLTTLPADVFNGLGNLQTLNLQDNDLTTLPADVFNGLTSLQTLNLSGNRTFTPGTGLPAGIFDDVLDTLGTITTSGINGFRIDAAVRDAHFVCSRDDADAIVTAIAGVDDCLRITAAQFAGVPTIAVLAASGAPAEPTDASSGDAVSGAFTLQISSAPDSGTATLTYALSGTAQASDYEITANTGVAIVSATRLTIDLAQASQAVLTLTPAHDTNVEGDETVILTVSGVDFEDDMLTDLTAVTDSPQTLTIRDNEAGICNRTPEVRDAILTRINAVEEPDVACDEVTRSHLEGITGFLVLRGQGIASLQGDDFAGLARLDSLDLANNALTTLPADVFNGLDRLDRLSLQGNAFTPGTGLPPGIFDDVLDTISVLVSDPAVRDAHFVCSRPDAAAIVKATTGVNNCLRITVAQLDAANTPIIATLGAPAEPTDASSGDAVAGAFTLRFSPALTSGTARVTYAITGTAIRDTDYTLAAGTGVTLDSPRSGQFTIDFTQIERAQAVLTLTPAHDAFTEPGETVILTVSGVDFDDDTLTDLTAVAGSPQTLTIRDNDAGICDRTPEVRDAIIARIPGRPACGAVTGTQLGAITRTINLSGQEIESLQAGDFAGLTGLQALQLNRNDLRSLPADVFAGLTSLENLSLQDNAFASRTGLPAGIFDDVLDTLGTITTSGINGFRIDAAVRAAHFVCWRPDADAIVAATDGVTDCLRITVAQFNAADPDPTARLTVNGSPAEPSTASSNDPVTGTFTLTLDNAPDADSTLSFTVNGIALPGSDYDLTVTHSGGTDITPGSLTNASAASVTVPAWVSSVLFTLTPRHDTLDDNGLDGNGEPMSLTINSVRFQDAETAVISDVTDSPQSLTIVSGICARTAGVQAVILAEIDAHNDCQIATTAQLAAITGTIDLDGNETGSSLAALQAGDFNGLSGVTILDLQRNSLQTLPDNIFDQMSALEELFLAGNSLTVLSGNVFDNLANLAVLDISGNSPLTSLPAGIFDSALESLETLFLDSGLTGTASLSTTSVRMERDEGADVTVVLNRAVPVAVRIPFTATLAGVSGAVVIPAGQGTDPGVTATLTASDIAAVGTGTFSLGTPVPGTINTETGAFTPITLSGTAEQQTALVGRLIGSAADAIPLTVIAGNASLTVSDASATEADGVDRTGTFTLTLADVDDANDAVFTYALSEGTATETDDYIISVAPASFTHDPVADTITIPAGSITATSGEGSGAAAGAAVATITIAAVDDALVESAADETVIISLTSPASIAYTDDPEPDNRTVRIVDDDTAVVSLTGADVDVGTGTIAVSEGGGSVALQVEITNAADLRRSVDVTLATSTESGQTAVVDTHYTENSQTLTFAQGDAAQTFTVPILLDDGVVNEARTFTITLTSNDPVTLPATSFVVTILDDDLVTGPTDITTLAPVTVAEDATGTATIVFDAEVPAGRMVTYTLTPSGTDQATDPDFTANITNPVTVALTAAAPSNTYTFPVAINDDSLIENSEEATLTVTAVSWTNDGGGYDATTDAQRVTTLTITDNEPSAVMSVTASDAAEGGSPTSVTVTLNRAATAATTVTWQILGGSSPAISNADIPGTLGADRTQAISVGEDRVTFTITPSADTAVESIENGIIAITNVSWGGAGEGFTATASDTFTITDDPAERVSVGVSTTSPVAEDVGNAGFTVSISGATLERDVEVRVFTRDGTAEAGEDYTLVDQTLTFNAGTTSHDIDVAITNDAIDESEEQFTLNLETADTAVTLSPASVPLAITDTDTSGITFDASGPTEGGSDGSFVITFAGAPAEIATVAYGISGNSFTLGEGAGIVAGTLTQSAFQIANGQIGGTLLVRPVEDEDIYDEIVTLNITGVTFANSAATIGAAESSLIIADNDTLTVGFASATPAINETDGTGIMLTVSGGTVTDARGVPVVTVMPSTGGATPATAGTDFANAAINMPINAAARTAGSVAVPLRGTNDDIVENNQTVALALTAAAEQHTATIATGLAAATGTIMDDDALTDVRFATATSEVVEGAAATIGVAASGLLERNVDVAFSLSGTNNGDYTEPSPLTVTIPADSGNSHSANISIDTTEDAAPEGPEDITLTLMDSGGDAAAYGLGTETTHILTINDDDVATAISSVVAAPDSVTEGGNVTVTVTLDAPLPTGEVRFNYAVAGVTASAATVPDDIAAGANNVLATAFVNGRRGFTFTVATMTDAFIESPESARITVSNITAPGVALAGPSDNTFTINDDEDANAVTVSLAAATANGMEGTGTDGAITLNITATLAAGLTLARDIEVTATASVGGTDTAAVTDFNAYSQTITFNAGNVGSAQTLTLRPVGDAIVENDEDFTLTLTEDDGNVALGTGTARLIITNDDALTNVRFATDESDVMEGDTATIGVQADGLLERSVAVTYTLDGTNNEDYTEPDPLTVTIPAGTGSSHSAEISIDTLEGNDEAEHPETLTLELAASADNPALYALSTTVAERTHTLTINDDDLVAGPTRITTFADVEIAEGTPEANAIATIVFDAAVPEGRMVTYTLTPSGANRASNADFTANISNPITIALTAAAGANRYTFPIAINNDSLVENSEQATLTVTAVNWTNDGGGLTGLSETATLTINDDDVATGIDTVSADDVTEGNAATVTVTLNDPLPPGDVRFNYAVAGMTTSAAAVPGDIAAGANNVLATAFVNGRRGFTFTVAAATDRRIENPEGVRVTVSNITATGVSITGSASGDFTITDAPPELTVTLSTESNVITETDVDIDTTIAITVEAANGATVILDRAVSVRVSAVADTATAGEDFTAISDRVISFGPVLTAANSFPETINVVVIGDTDPESLENFTVTVAQDAPPDPAVTIGNDGTLTITIADDDAQTGVDHDPAGEEELPSFRIRLDREAPAEISVSYLIINNGETTGSGSVSVSEGKMLSAPITVQPGATVDILGFVLPGGNVMCTRGCTSTEGDADTGSVPLYSSAGITPRVVYSNINVVPDNHGEPHPALAVTSGVGGDGRITEGLSGDDDTATITLTVSDVPATAMAVVVAYELTIRGAHADAADFTARDATTMATLLMSDDITIRNPATTVTADITITANRDDDVTGETVTLTITGISFMGASSMNLPDLNLRESVRILDADAPSARSMAAETKGLSALLGSEQVALVSGLVRQRMDSAPVPEATGNGDMQLSLADQPQDMQDFFSELALESSGEMDSGGSYSVWARGQWVDLSGSPSVDGATFSYDGSITGAGMGVERRSDNLLAGVSISHFMSDIKITSGSRGEAKHEETVTVVAPYAIWKPGSGNRTFWGTMGAGVGEAKISGTSGAASPGLTMFFAQGGADIAAPVMEGVETVLGVSGLVTSKTIDGFAIDDAVVSDVKTSTARGEIDFTAHFPLSIGDVPIRPWIGIASIHDAGDVLADDRHAIELRSGISLQGSGVQVSFEAFTRFLRKDQKLWGVSGEIRYAAPGEGGFSAGLTADHGTDESSSSLESAADLPDSTNDGREAEMTLGLDAEYVTTPSFVHEVTPFFAARHASTEQSIGYGLRLGLTENIAVTAETDRHFPDARRPYNRHSLNLRARWGF